MRSTAGSSADRETNSIAERRFVTRSLGAVAVAVT
jgi:hypothetical protein